jgi:hypothetical protein
VFSLQYNSILKYSSDVYSLKALPQLNRLTRPPGFDPRPIHVRVLVNKMALGQVLLGNEFSSSVSFHHCSIVIYQTTFQ